MYQSSIKTSQHVWEKKNLVTVNSRGRMFDEMVCKNCGMKGRREVSENYKLGNVHLCPKATPIKIPNNVSGIYAYPI